MPGNWFKRAQRGLYAGRMIMFGNNISFSHRKTRRTWLPNVQHKKLFSELLKAPVPMRLTTHALRCIDRAGGLDNYLLTTPDRRLQSEFGSELKAKLRAVYKEQNGVDFDAKPLILAKRAERVARTIANRAAKDAKAAEIAERDRLAREKAEAEAAEKAAAVGSKAARSTKGGAKAGKEKQKPSPVDKEPSSSTSTEEKAS